MGINTTSGSEVHKLYTEWKCLVSILSYHQAVSFLTHSASILREIQTFPNTYIWFPWTGDASSEGTWLMEPGFSGVLVFAFELSFGSPALESGGLDTFPLFPLQCWLSVCTSFPRLSIPRFNSPNFWIDLQNKIVKIINEGIKQTRHSTYTEELFWTKPKHSRILTQWHGNIFLL